ncbi:DUF2515 domain-containing protein [Metabacillus malikii]|uniref:DUF2515 domain-containing protein n=1 Tax=Metabacillus malikii TaxID=1504265 RepID=A0ABT9Z953_9BACI|nr:DUF2515 domain-containing protein [Metabacillus malikii]MDQ0228794.1 hypothetical protein [Metabacillus malikii]
MYYRKKANISEDKMITSIVNTTKVKNYDNISRTKAYENYYFQNAEITWSYLASMVSRNAGWSMTDLKGKWFQKALTSEQRSMLFMTYERANWLIFHDAFPQLLLYEWSKHLNRPLFHLLKYFHVSRFMETEWNYFWEHHEKERLLTALIINEQNVIQKPVIENRQYKYHVFSTLPYKLQDYLHFSSVIFPTVSGKLFGFTASDFQRLSSRIELGKRLAWLLFHAGLYEQFIVFSKTVEHSGSRYDYERYFPDKRKRETPLLRTSFPIVSHTIDENREDWFHGQKTKKWFKERKIPKDYEITDWFNNKQNQLHLLTLLQEYKGRKKG